MRKIGMIFEVAFFVCLLGYLYLVAIKEMIGTPFTPVHDGVLLVLAVLVGFIWFVLPLPSMSQDEEFQSVEVSVIALIGLQVIILLQVGTGVQTLQGIQFVLTFLASILFAAGGLLFVSQKDGEKVSDSSIGKFLDKTPTRRFPIIGRTIALGGLGLLTIFPWAFWALSQVGVPVSTLSAFIGLAVVGFTLIFAWKYRRVYVQDESKDLTKNTLMDLFPNVFRLSIHGLSVLVVLLIVGGVGYYGYAFQRPDEDALQGPRLSLIETTDGWTVLEGGVYSTEAAFFSDQFLKFTISVDEEDFYRPTFLAEVSDLGGQIAFEVEEINSGEVVEQGELLPFQCSFWIKREIFDVFLKDNGCPEFPIEIELTPIEFDPEKTYELTILVTDEFPSRFNEEFQVRFGGYIQLQDFELRRQ